MVPNKYNDYVTYNNRLGFQVRNNRIHWVNLLESLVSYTVIEYADDTGIHWR